MKVAFIGTGNMGGALARAAALEEDNELLLVNGIRKRRRSSGPKSAELSRITPERLQMPTCSFWA